MAFSHVVTVVQAYVLADKLTPGITYEKVNDQKPISISQFCYHCSIVPIR